MVMRLILILGKTLLFSFFILNFNAFGQISDSIRLEFSPIVAFSNNSYLPHYIVSNRYGLLNSSGKNALLKSSFLLPYQGNKNFTFSLGLSIVASASVEQNNLFAQEGYLKVKYRALEFWGGQVEQTLGIHMEELSSGSLALSRNARPFPMVQLIVPEYVDVPFTKGHLKFKGNFGHGWFEKDRYVQHPVLHFKSLYLQSDVNFPLDFYAGIVHFALWGGKHPNGVTIPNGFKDYLRVIVGKSSLSKSLSNEYFNALGDHLGIVEYGFITKAKYFDVTVYNQMPYEDKTGLKRFFFSKDRLVGVDIKFNKTIRPIHVLYEYLYTLYQSGPGVPDPPKGYSRKDLAPNYGYYYGGRDDYYNNSLYRSGWTYLDRILGNPMFMTEKYAANFLEHVNSFHQDIVNNRVRAHHVGIKASLSHDWSFKFLSTYSRNYGTYAGLNGGQKGWLSKQPAFNDYQYAFKKPLRQWYWLVESTTALNKGSLHATLSIGYDTGQIYDAVGVMGSLQWLLHFSRKH